MNGRALAAALSCAMVVTSSARASQADAPAALASPSAAAAPVETVPAVVRFPDRDVYRGDVRLDYGSLPGLPTSSASIAFSDGKRHRRGYVVVPNGRGTFTTSDGTRYADTTFVDGRAWGSGTLTVPATPARAPLRFTGIFVAGAPLYGTVGYANGDAYTGYFSDGCFAGAPAVLPTPPPNAPDAATLFAGLPGADVPGAFTQANGFSVRGVWQHASGAPCGPASVAHARVTFPDGDVYAGDLDGSGHFRGFAATYAAGRGSGPDVLSCGTYAPPKRFAAGTYAVTIGRFDPPGDDPQAFCSAERDDVTVMTVSVRAPDDALDGSADIRFADGDRATGTLHDGVLSGPGTYVPRAYPATIHGVFRNGRLAGPARLIDAHGRAFDVVVRDGVVTSAPGAQRAYLFSGDDWIAGTAAAALDGHAVPDGYGTEHLADGQTVTAFWRRGRPSGHVIVRVLRPFAATIEVADARAAGRRIRGRAVVRFANGDVAEGALDVAAGDEPRDFTALEGAGTYRFAASGCTARGTFRNGRLVGRAVLACPHEAPYAGIVAGDGTVQ